MHFITPDPKTVKKITVNGNKRVICTLNGKITIHAALMKTKEGTHYIMIGAKYLKELNLKAGDKVTAVIQVDKTPLQFNLPEEFAEVMNTDPEALKIFNGLTDGNKRGLIALVNMVKSSDKKIERALKIAAKLKMGITSPQKVMK